MSSITEDQFRGLPEAPLAKFLALETIARERLMQALEEEENDALISIAKQTYMSTVAVAARKLGIHGVTGGRRISALASGFDSFFRQVIETTTEIHLTATEVLNLYSVRISGSTRQDIQKHIDVIKEWVAEEAPEAKQERLNRLLSSLETELDRPRSSLSRVMAILALVGTIGATTVGALAALPDAIGTITALIGQDKDAEPHRIQDLSDEIKLLPPPLDAQGEGIDEQ